MALTTVEIQIGENSKRKAEKLCEEMEMTLQEYLRFSVLMLLEEGDMPFWKFSPMEKALKALQLEAQKNGIADMTLDEINEMIAEVRAERQARQAAEQSAEVEVVREREAVASYPLWIEK